MARRLLLLTQAVDAADPNLGFFLAWIREMATKTDRVTVIALRAGNASLPENVRVIPIGNGSASRRFFRMLQLLAKEVRCADAVLAHMAPEYAIMAAPWAKLFGKRLGLWYTHKSVTRRLRWAVRLCDTIFTASKESFRIPSPKVRVMGHGIDFTVFRPAAAPPPAEVYRLLSVSRLAPSKGIPTLLKAIAILHEQGWRDISLTIVGDAYLAGDVGYADSLHRLAAELGVASFVDWHGAVPHAELPEIYRNHHAFLHASETGSLDKAVLEALASGLLVFSSSEAFRSLLPASWQFLPGDAAALADCLKKNRHTPFDPSFHARLQQEHSITQMIPRLLDALFGASS